MKIALLGNYTLDYFKKAFLRQLSRYNIEIYNGGYNQYNQEILDPKSELYKFQPSLVFIMLQGDKLFSQVYAIEFLNLPQSEKIMILDKISLDIENLVLTLRNQIGATVVMNNFYIPFYSPLDILDTKNQLGLKSSITRINEHLNNLSTKIPQLFIFDYNGFIGHHGFAEVFEHKAYYLTKTYERKCYLDLLAKEYSRYIYSFKGLAKKCIVLDLDNTLWGGVVGEDGIEGIRLDIDGRGRSFWDFQQALRNIHSKGILLAICSKNNYDDAMNVIETHPYMILRKEYFSSTMINWNDKASNIEAIAKELKIGLDSMVFLDDNPFERELVKGMLPDVMVVDLPEDTSQYTKTLNELPCFSKFQLTDEDRTRNKMYRENALRDEQLCNFSNIEDYLKSLEMELTFGYADDFSINRVHQLLNKTNQFNMTTKRYTLEEVKELSLSKEKSVIHISLKDKFGDNGIIGVVILEFTEIECVIDTFLLSCRVLGRRVEEMILDNIVQICKNKGINTILASYIPTQKNVAYKDVYKKNGWQEIGQFGQELLHKLNIRTYINSTAYTIISMPKI